MYLLDDRNHVFEVQDSDIICIEVSRPHIYYRTTKGKYRAPRTIVEFLSIYGTDGFIQIDKKKMVNLLLADKFEDGNIHFGHLNYAVSRRNAPKVQEALDQMNHD